MVNVPQVQIPDFASTIARGQQVQQSRLQGLLAQQSLDEAQRFNAALPGLAGALATGEGPQYDSALAQLLATGPRGAQMALPLVQESRQRREAAAFDWGGGGRAAAPRAATPAPGGPVTPAVAPADLMPFIEEASRETGIPVPVLVAQIRQESNFDPRARGRAGEIGLGQIMPATARAPGYGVQPVDPAALDDPRTNVRFQAQYLRGRGQAAGVTDWNDPAQVDRALAAYNGGGDPNYVQNVRRWMPQGAPQPGGDTVQASGPATPGQPAPSAGQPRISPGEMAVLERALASPNPIIRQRAQARIQMLQLQQRGETEPMEVVTGPNGQPVLVPRSQAAGRQPASREAAPRSAERFEQDRALAEAGASRSSTTVNAGDRRTDVLIADAWKASEDTAVAAGRRALLMGRAEQAFERFPPGVLAERRLWLGQMARELGIRTPGTAEGEVLQQVQRQLELATTPQGQGAITENERGLIRQAIPVLLSTPEGARQAIALIRRLDDYEMQIARIYRQNARENGGQPNAVSVREQIADFVSRNQPPDVQAVIENLSGPVQGGGVQADPPERRSAPPQGFRRF